MPPADDPRTSNLVLDVTAGPAGLGLMAEAVAAALAGGPPVALVPAYAPSVVVAGLRRRLAAALARETRSLPADTAVIIPTSGSTGDPRLVLLGRQALSAAAAARDEVQGGPTAWFVTLPAVTAATLIAVVRARLGHRPLAAWPGIGGTARFTAESFVTAATAFLASESAAAGVVRTSLVAAQLARIMADPAGIDCLRRFDAVLIGGGPAAPALVQAAREQGIRITLTYGMTETCGGCVYDGWPTPGTEVALADDGEVLLGGAPLASGYLDSDLPHRGRLFRTGDRGRFEPDGRLSVLGRFDDLVMVRGATVDRAAVAATVTALPGVQDAAVVAESDPDGGHRLVAYLVGDVNADELRAAVAQKLGAAAVPAVRRVAMLPRLAGGKVDTQRLAKGFR